jgi:uncharacterized protein YjbK
MSKQLEIEFKTLLTKEEYQMLVARFSNYKGDYQTNYYFDTPRFSLKAAEVSLRVRVRDNYEITVKRKKGYALQETNNIITKEQFDDFVKTGNVPVEETRQEINEIVGNQKIVNYMSLTTYRINIPYKKGLIAIDKCEYLDVVDYELEYEAANYEQGKKEFVEIVNEFGIKYKKSEPKIKRAYNALKQKL